MVDIHIHVMKKQPLSMMKPKPQASMIGAKQRSTAPQIKYVLYTQQIKTIVVQFLIMYQKEYKNRRTTPVLLTLTTYTNTSRYYFTRHAVWAHPHIIRGAQFRNNLVTRTRFGHITKSAHNIFRRCPFTQKFRINRTI